MCILYKFVDLACNCKLEYICAYTQFQFSIASIVICFYKYVLQSRNGAYNFVKPFVDTVQFYYTVQDKCDFRPQTAYSVNGVSPRKPAQNVKETPDRRSPEKQRRLRHQGDPPL